MHESQREMHLPYAPAPAIIAFMQKDRSHEVVDRLVKATGKKATDVAREAGVNQSTMSRIINRRIENPTDRQIYPLAKYFGLSSEQVRGREPISDADMQRIMGVAEGRSSIESNVSGPPLPLREGRVPVIGTAQLGTDGYFDPMEYPVGHGDGYLLIYSDDEDAYGLKVVGNSMMPRIRHGEYVVIEPNHEFTAGDEVLVRTTDGQAMIKEFISCRDGQYRFQSINNDFEPIFIDEDQVECVQFMSAIVKASRYVP